MTNSVEARAETPPNRVEISLPEPRRSRPSISVYLAVAFALFGIGFAAGRLLPGLLFGG